MNDALTRERRIKKWKLDLIEQSNPQWRDLYGDLAS
jgi:putative endonuclease